jgi:hypothetical protein
MAKNDEGSRIEAINETTTNLSIKKLVFIEVSWSGWAGGKTL